MASSSASAPTTSAISSRGTRSRSPGRWASDSCFRRSRSVTTFGAQLRILIQLAEARFEAGEIDEAFDLVRTWALDNNDAGAWYTLADFSRRSNDPDTAKEAIVRAIEIDPEGSASYYMLAAEIDVDLLQDTNSALRRLRQAYGLEPGNQEISDRIRAYGEIPGPTLVLPPGP